MKEENKNIEAIDLALMCARIARDKKGEDITILDMQEVFPMCEYFVLITGANKRHIQTIADEISKSLKRENRLALSIEGHSQGWWVLIDYVEVVVHIFARDAREYYDLENHWGDAKPVDWEKLEHRRTGS